MDGRNASPVVALNSRPPNMGTKSLARKSRTVKKASETPPRAQAGDLISKERGPTLHRGRKKREATKQRLERKKSFIASELERAEAETARKREEEAKKRAARKGAVGPALAVLSEMAAALPAGADETGRAEEGERAGGRGKKMRHKARRRIAVEEAEQLRQVRAHAMFQADPVEALRQHLVNTVAADPGAVPAGLGKGKSRAGGEKGRGGRGGEAGKAGGLVADGGAVERAREEARRRVEEKRERKAGLAEAAARLRKKRQGGRIGKQTLKGVVGGGRRGRIGEKRDKVLE